VNKHATLRKDANILSRRWLFVFITNNPIRVDPLTAESVILVILNGKKFKVRGLMGHFCDILEMIFGMTIFTQKIKSKFPE
jgi:hypothetical protein